MKKKRPYFSVVIACYNDGRYKEGVYLDRLLESLTKQGMKKDEVEVILSDDHSPVPYDEIVDKYTDKLVIKRITTDYNFAPGNTRAKGLELVTGEWLCFADHDDLYFELAFQKVKECIEAKGEKYFAFTDFLGVTPDGKVNRKFEATLNWCHAKFYNWDNLWRPFNIAFIKDLKSHEDIAICAQVDCALSKLGISLKEISYFPFVTYAWTDNPQSISHAKYTVDTESGPREFLEVHFADYIRATGTIYLDEFDSHDVSYQYAVKHAIEIVCYCYFYTQGFMFRRPDDFLKVNMGHAGEFVRRVMKTFNITLSQIYDVVASNNAYMYYHIRSLADPGSGQYIATYTFKNWLNIVSTSYIEDKK